MRIRLTHVLASLAPPAFVVSAVATDLESGRGVLLPGTIPCGECGPCRRALTVLCARTMDLPAQPGAELDVPERFATPLDDPGTGTPAVAPERAVTAGLVATALEAAARAGLGAGDVCAIVGEGGAADRLEMLAVMRGCRVVRLGSDGGDTRAQEALASIEAQMPGAFSERKVFVSPASPAFVDQASGLCRPGSTLVLCAPTASVLGLPVDALRVGRVLVTRGYHPDFLSEALVALQRDSAEGKLSQLNESPAVGVLTAI